MDCTLDVASSQPTNTTLRSPADCADGNVTLTVMAEPEVLELPWTYAEAAWAGFSRASRVIAITPPAANRVSDPGRECLRGLGVNGPRPVVTRHAVELNSVAL